MTNKPTHISICICTFKRPELLLRCLKSLEGQATAGLFTYSIVIADNDETRSAELAVGRFMARTSIAVVYCVEPQQNIAMARNRAVQNATGDFVAFIDDDEFAIEDWLLTLFNAIQKYDVDGVLGPVDPHFDEGAPKWVIKGGFYDRPTYPTGMVLPWKKCRTGNVLLKRELFAGDAHPFRPGCLSGEDQDFFRRKIEKRHRFIWCHEAPAYEVVPPVRWKRSFLVRRALLRGIFAQRNHGLQPVRVLQALVSAPFYALMLPVALPFGQALFMKCAFKLSYHMGRLFALVGFNPIRQAYVTE
jgi:glycosyltransferase involved in cell wall biosynthesis